MNYAGGSDEWERHGKNGWETFERDGVEGGVTPIPAYGAASLGVIGLFALSFRRRSTGLQFRRT